MTRRRGNNEGSIHQRKDGRWVGSVSLGYAHGNRQRKHVFGKTRQEAASKLHDVLQGLEQGISPPPDNVTVARFLSDWLKESVASSVRPRTYESYSMIVGRHLKPALGRIRLRKLTARHIQSYPNDKLAGGLSPSTVRGHHAVLRAALSQAEKWGLVTRNVAKLVDPPIVKRAAIVSFTPEQCRAFLDVVAGDRLEGFYVTALALGLRKGELLGLRWDDVDFDSRTVRVRAALQYVNGSLTLVEPKTELSRRAIIMPETLVSALRAHRSGQARGRLLSGPDWKDWGLVFATPFGTPLDQSRVSKHFKRMLKKAALPDMRFHDLRHSCASLLLAQHVPARVVMEILGHSTISLTMNTYSHVIPALHQEAADRMDGVLRGTAWPAEEPRDQSTDPSPEPGSHFNGPNSASLSERASAQVH